jgi:type II secretory pathway component PulK
MQRRSRGIALLVVLVVLVLIATLATEIAITARTHYKLADNSMEELLLRSAVDARVPVLKAALRYDGTNGSGYDGEADDWAWHNHERLSSWGERATNYQNVESDAAQSVAAFKNTDAKITAWCEDERSKLNLRGLMRPEDTDVFRNTRDTLIRLIDLYREKWSSLDLSEGDAKDMVDDLVRWAQAEADTEDNPMPAVKPNRGRLQSLDDLLRVPGGHWTAERLEDVKDPEADEDAAPVAQDTAEGTSNADDVAWVRGNGVPGLMRYLTVWAEDVADPPMRININTAPLVVFKALLDSADEDLAEKAIEHRREGAAEPASATGSTSSTSTSGTSGTTGTTGTTSGKGGGTDQANQGFFRAKADLAKVEGFEQDLAKYPRLNFFADVQSNVYSLRVIARVVRSSGEDSGGSEDSAPKEIAAVHDLKIVVQRTNAGFLTLYVERRTDPLFDQ